MIRGTTPTLEFELPFEVSLVQNAYVTLAQNDITIINKHLTDCHCGTNTLKVQLTQQDTLRFNTNDPIEIQIRVVTTSGEALASEIWTEYAEKVLYEGII